MLKFYFSGTPYLTDSCITSILGLNPLSRLKRFIMSHPVGQDQPLMVPLTARTVTALHKSCFDLQCIGDLKYWALTSVQRRKLSFDLGCTLSIAKQVAAVKLKRVHRYSQVVGFNPPPPLVQTQLLTSLYHAANPRSALR